MITQYGRIDDLGSPDAGPGIPVSNQDGQQEGRLAIIGDQEVKDALATLQTYRDAKQNLEQQIIEDEQWYKIRHWDVIRSQDGKEPEPASAWLFNTIQNKHADAMDYYPDPNVLPREEQDKDAAETLSEIIPCILERAHFEQTYRMNWWEKLKHGCGVYMPRWDNTMYNGLGDIAVDRIDLLNIFWQPGIEDIQDSRNVFVLSLRDNDLLAQEYPEIKDKLGKGGNSGTLQIPKYIHEDNIDTTDKTVVVDWYYKIRNEQGREILHYAKICADTLLFSSQNSPEYQDGWYHHGKYPFVFDTIYPEKGFPTGFGFIAICRDPQLYIDKLNANIMETSLINSKIRYLMSEDIEINEQDLLDTHKPIVKVSKGRISPEKLQQIKGAALDASVIKVVEDKVNEMKETTANRDFSQGGTSGGVTAASAIAALQEAGNKVSRDMIFGSYDAYRDINYMLIELVRQFYTEERFFRITGKDGNVKFISFDGRSIQAQPTADDMVREPVFDIVIKPQKRSPFAREAQNQLAMEFYGAGFFDPANAPQALACLDMMDFEGIEQVRAKISENGTLMDQLMQAQAVNQQIMAQNSAMQAAINDVATGQIGASRQGGAVL